MTELLKFTLVGEEDMVVRFMELLESDTTHPSFKRLSAFMQNGGIPDEGLPLDVLQLWDMDHIPADRQPAFSAHELKEIHRLFTELMEPGAILKASFLTPPEVVTLLSILKKLDPASSG